jgi:hypothetical protein
VGCCASTDAVGAVPSATASNTAATFRNHRMSFSWLGCMPGARGGPRA